MSAVAPISNEWSWSGSGRLSDFGKYEDLAVDNDEKSDRWLDLRLMIMNLKVKFSQFSVICQLD